MSGVKSRMKDFRRTPKQMVRIPPNPEKDNAPPSCESGDEEDDVSTDRHVKMLKQECKKGKPNLKVVTELMAATFKRRHKEILDRPAPVSVLLQKYPAFQSCDEVRCNVRPFMLLIIVTFHLSSCLESSEESPKIPTFERMQESNGRYGHPEYSLLGRNPQVQLSRSFFTNMKLIMVCFAKYCTQVL